MQQKIQFNELWKNTIMENTTHEIPLKTQICLFFNTPYKRKK